VLLGRKIKYNFEPVVFKNALEFMMPAVDLHEGAHVQSWYIPVVLKVLS